MNEVSRQDEEVADLFVRIDAGQASAADLDRVVEWARNDPGKLDRFAALTDLWQTLGKVGPEAVRVDESRVRKPRLFAAAAAVLLALGAGAVYLLHSSGGNVREYATAVGELRKLALADGSYVHLNGDSAVAIELGSERRHVRLERGEAFFDVAPDSRRAFVVEAGKVRVQAVGTTFNVDYSRGEVTVAVSDGAVRVTPAVASGSDATAGAIAHAGERVRVRDTGRDAVPEVVVMPSAGMRNAESLAGAGVSASAPLSWREGVLQLSGESLAVAAERINRQSSRQLAVADVRLENLPIYGSFHLRDVESFIRAVEVLYPVRHMQTEQGYLLMYDED